MQHGDTIDECRDERGWALIHYAAANGNSEACWDLLQQGADGNIQTGSLVKDGPLRKDWYWDPGNTPLLLAAETGCVEAVKVLIKGGARVATRNGHIATMETLLRLGAEPRVRESQTGLTPAEMGNARQQDE